MNHITNSLSAALLSATIFLSGGPAKAMTFPQFDHMAAQDRQDYLDFMVKSAVRVLNEQGRGTDAEKIDRLFSEISPGSDLPIGEAELETNLASARVRDAERFVKNPDAPRIQVEAALIGTLDKNGVELSPEFVKSFLHLTSTFKPKH